MITHTEIKEEITKNYIISDLASIIADYAQLDLPDLNDHEKKLVDKIAQKFKKNYQHFFHKQFKKNYGRIWSPFSEAEPNILLNFVLIILTAGSLHLTTMIPSFIMALGQAAKKKKPDSSLFDAIAYELFLFNKLPGNVQKNLLQQCIKNYKSIKYKPTYFHTKTLIWDLECFIKHNERADRFIEDEFINDIIHYLSNPVNATSRFYQLLVNELRNVPALYEENLAKTSNKMKMS